MNKKSSNLLVIMSTIFLLTTLGCSGKSKYDLVEDKEAIEQKKELTAFESKRSKEELSEWL